jgi:hypothetical protein
LRGSVAQCVGSASHWALKSPLAFAQGLRQDELKFSGRFPASSAGPTRTDELSLNGLTWRIELRLDVLNALNDTAEESIRSEVYNAATVGQANVFIDPRRAMLSVRLNLGR